MSSEQNQQPSIPPPLCATGCGFYGNPTTRNLCSKCHREQLKKEQHTTTPMHQTQMASSTANMTMPTESSDGASQENRSETIIIQINNNDNHPHITSTGGPNVIRTAMQVEPESTALSETTTMQIDMDMTPMGVAIPTDSATLASMTDLHNSDNSTGTSTDNNTAIVKEQLNVTDAEATGGIEESSEEKQLDMSRCWRCNKRVGLLGFQCRCGFAFCASHRYSDAHDCSFDYKTFGRLQLSKVNQKVVAEKLNKI